jgi:hypothetical protein
MPPGHLAATLTMIVVGSTEQFSQSTGRSTSSSWLIGST